MKGSLLKKISNVLFLTAKCLKENETYINSLNVFPVADGDTGSNMFMTINETISKCKKVDEENFLDCFSRNLILSAQGNSGIIFSQFLKGFIEALKGKDEEIESIKHAFSVGVREAYNIVDDPKEGTILTVMRKSREAFDGDFNNLLEALHGALEAGIRALKETPKLLPQLLDAGVYDAGGAGFICFLNSLFEVFGGKKKNLDDVYLEAKKSYVWKISPRFSHCLEVDVKLKEAIDKEDIRSSLKNMGDSLMIIKEKDFLKVHIHTDGVDEVINFLKKFGNIESVVDKDMMKEHWEFIFDTDIALVSFSNNEDMKKLFYSLGISIVLDTSLDLEKIKEKIERIPVKNIIIMPWNTENLLKLRGIKWEGDKEIKILKSSSLPEVIEAALSFDVTLSLEKNFKRMVDSLTNLKVVFIKYENGIFKFKMDNLFFKYRKEKIESLINLLLDVLENLKEILMVLNKERNEEIDKLLMILQRTVFEKHVNKIEIRGITYDIILGIKGV